MEDEVKYQKEKDIKVMVVLRLRYRKPVNPSCDIVEMSWDVWREFLRSSHKDRLKIAQSQGFITHRDIECFRLSLFHLLIIYMNDHY